MSQAGLTLDQIMTPAQGDSPFEAGAKQIGQRLRHGVEQQATQAYQNSPQAHMDQLRSYVSSAPGPNQQAALEQVGQRAQANNAHIIQQHPILGRLANLTQAMSQGLGTAAAGIHGGPDVNAELQGLNLTAPVVPQTGTRAAKGLGEALPSLGASMVPGVGVPLAAGLLAAQSGGGTKGEIQNRREAGEAISPEQEQTEIAKSAALAGTAGLLAPGAAKVAEGLLPQGAGVAQRLLRGAAGGAAATATGAGIQGQPLTLQDVVSGAAQGVGGGHAEEHEPLSLQDIVPGHPLAEQNRNMQRVLAEHESAMVQPPETPARPVQPVEDVSKAVDEARATRPPLPRRRGMINLPGGEGPFKEQPEERPIPAKPDEVVSKWQQAQQAVSPLKAQPLNPRRRGMIQLPGGSEGPFKEQPETPVAKPPTDEEKTISQWQKQNKEGAAPVLRDMPLNMRRRAGSVPLPSEETVRSAQGLVNAGPVAEKLRGMTAGFEKDTHNIMLNMQEHFPDFEKTLDTPEKEAAFVDAIDKTPAGQKPTSPFPELQPAVDKYVKLHQDLIDRDKALGITGEGHTPGHIQFMANPTERTLPSVTSGSGISGPEGFSYKRESANWKDFLDKTQEAGMERPYKNIGEMMAAGLAQRSKAVNAREMIENDWKPRGLAENMPSKGKLPDGWSKAPGIENTMVPNDVAKSLDYYFKSRGPGEGLAGSLRWMNSAAQSSRYIGDMVTATRAVAANVSNTISGALRGMGLKANPITALMRGRKVMKNSAETLRANPATAPLADWLDKSVEGGLRTSAMEKLPRPDVQRTTLQKVKDVSGSLLTALNHEVTGPMKVGWANLAAEYSSNKVGRGEWNEQEAGDFNRRYVKAQDDMFGSSGGVTVTHPGIKQAVDLVSPLYRYQTAGARTLGRGIGETIASKSITKGTLPEAISGIAAQVAVSLGAAAAISKATTGNVIPPTSMLDMFFPKTGKNPDGSDKRLAVAGSVLPLAESIVRLSKGEFKKAMAPMMNPAIPAIAEAITNHDWQGNIIGNTGDDILHAIKGAVNPIAWSELERGNISDAFGVRNAPQDIGRSKAYDMALDMEHAQRAPQPTDNPAETQMANFSQQLHQNWDGKTDVLHDPKLAPIVDQMRQSLQQGIITNDEVRGLINDSKKRIATPGIAGVPFNHALSPQQLLQIYQTATPAEQNSMKPAFEARFSKLTKDRTPNLPDWIALGRAVRAK